MILYRLFGLLAAGCTQTPSPLLISVVKRAISEWPSGSSSASFTRKMPRIGSLCLMLPSLIGAKASGTTFDVVPYSTSSIFNNNDENIPVNHPRVGLESLYISWQTVGPLRLTAASCTAIILTRLCSHVLSRILAWITTGTEPRLNNAATSTKQGLSIQLGPVEAPSTSFPDDRGGT
jgi:hypothetical protein